MKLRQTRKFGHERFSHYETVPSKTEANQRANALRSRGFKVRIVHVTREKHSAYELLRKRK